MIRTPGPAPISGVRNGSLAEEAGIEAGDQLLELDGRVLRDAVDYQFYQAAEEVQVHLRKANGLEELLVFEKEIDEDIGIEFERATWDDVTLCNNNCFFCFLKGLPKGLRKPLYLKDDDYRLSFLHGNFVTLTNLDESDWDRLAEQRLSPLNISVHATDLKLRRSMLGNASAPHVLEQIRRLGALDLRVHAQIVLCPGVNDGAWLEQSLAELVALYPVVQTVSVVPVGASPRLEEWSETRDGIRLERPTPEYARSVVALMRPIQRQCRREHGVTVAQCSDEYYLASGEPIPGRASYDGFPQYENGVGMVRTMLEDWTRTKRRLARQPRPAATGRIAIATGALAAPVLTGIAAEAEPVFGAAIEVVPVVNSLFGERVNVAGLLPGAAFAEALARVAGSADAVVLPRASLDYFGKQFLDGMTPAALEGALGVPVFFASQWSEVGAIVQGRAKPARRGEQSNGAMWSEPVHGRLPAGAVWAEQGEPVSAGV
ncbi:MAG: DUF512 domain-containing protein [Dehalococcoidia bacterium]